MATWRDEKILELANQLTYSPADIRREQLSATLALFPDIDPAKSYPWDFVHFRITGFKPVEHSDRLLAGKLLRTDLAKLIEFLSGTLAITVEEVASAGDAVLTLEETAKKFTVSSKTIHRWRSLGLIAQRYVYPDGRQRLGFLESAATRFAAANKERVDRSADFTQLSQEERKRIIDMARALVAHQPPPHNNIKQVSRRIAAAIGRSPGAVRYTLRHHDREHPEVAIFRLPGEIARAADGTAREPAPATSIFHVVAQERARKVKTLRIGYVPNPLFEHPDAENIIMHVLPAEALAKAQASVAAGVNPASKDVYMVRMPRDLPACLQDIFRQPVMPHELETDAFRRYNYLRYKAAKRQEFMDIERAAPSDLAEIETLLVQANQIKNDLVQGNLRVAVHVARKHQRPGRPLPELFSDATIWLMRAAEQFDFSRPVRFSTYASYSIMRNFAYDREEGLTGRQARVLTGQQEILNTVGDRETAPPEAAADQVDSAALHADLLTVIEELSSRERELLSQHYGLAPDQPAMTLGEIGDKMGLTKQRVRQLEARALRKLRLLLESRPKK